jgi:hypothetical protein
MKYITNRKLIQLVVADAKTLAKAEIYSDSRRASSQKYVRDAQRDLEDTVEFVLEELKMKERELKRKKR